MAAISKINLNETWQSEVTPMDTKFTAQGSNSDKWFLQQQQTTNPLLDPSIVIDQQPFTADAGQNNVEMGRPFLQEFRDDSMTGEIRCVAWHPAEMWLAAAGGWETEASEDMNINDQSEKAYVIIWDLTSVTRFSFDDGEEEDEDTTFFGTLFEEEKIDTGVTGEQEDEAGGTDNQKDGSDPGLPSMPQSTARSKGQLMQKYQGKSAWNSVTWSPDGTKLALCAEKPDEDPASVFIWSKDDISSGESTSPDILHSLHSGDVKVVAFCSEGTRLASAAWDNTVIIYWLDSDPVQPKVMVKDFSYGIHSISWAPDLWPISHQQDVLAIGSEDLEVILWQVPKSYEDKDEFLDHHAETKTVESSRDCLILCDQSDGNIMGSLQEAYKNWQRHAHGSKTRVLVPGHEGSVTHVAWHPVQPVLATGSWDNSVAVWDLALVYEGHTDCLFLEGHKRNVNCVGWNCQGDLLASGSDDGTIVIWVVETATKLQVLEGHQGPVLYINWHPTNPFTLASGSKDHDTQTIVWNHKAMEKPVELSTQKAMMCLSVRAGAIGLSKSHSAVLSGRTMKLCAIRWSTSGQKVVFATHEDIFLWNMVTTAKELMPSAMAQKKMCKIAAIAWVQHLKKDSLAIAKLNIDDSIWHIEIWDTHAFVCIKDFNVSPIAATPGLNGEPGTEYRHGHQHEVRDIAFTSDGELFASGGNDEDIFIWSYSTSKLVKVMTQHSDWVRCLTWCPHRSGKEWWLASASDDSCVIVWGIKEVSPEEDSACIEKTYSLFSAMKLEGHRGAVYSVEWGPNGQVASGSFDKTIAIWDLRKIEFREENSLRQPGSHCKWKCVFAQRDIQQQGIRYLDGHKQEVYDIAWTRDGKTISSCSEDNTIIIWNAKEGKLQQVIPSGSGSGVPVRSIYWNPHSKSPRLATATLDNQIFIHCILKIPSLTSQKKAAEHLANTRRGRAVLAELVRGDFLSLGTKQEGETLAYFLLKALSTSEGKEKASYARAVDVLLKSAIEEGDFFYNCKDMNAETLSISDNQNRSRGSMKGLKERLNSPRIRPDDNRNALRAPISILAMAIKSSDVYVIKAVLEFVKAGLCMRRNGKRISLMQAMARENLHKDMVLLLQKFPDQADEFLNSIGLLLAPISVLEDSQNVELGRKSRLLLATKHLCEAGLWQRNWKTCFKNQQGVFSWVFDLKGHMHRLHSLVPTDPEDLFLKPHKQALITGFPNCMSREFLQAVMKSPKQETLFHVPMIRLIYEYKWQRLKATFQIRLFFYCLYLSLLTYHMLLIPYDKGTNGTVLTLVVVINSYFALSECMQIYLDLKAYLSNVWNYFDLASILCTYVFFLPLMNRLDIDRSELRAVGAVLALLAWIKLLHYALASRHLAALVQSVLVICRDIVSFLIILMVFFMAFGVAFNVLEVFSPKTFDYTLLNNFLMILGDFALSDFQDSLSGDLAVLLFVAFQFIVFIVLLNALIAIMGDSFEKAQQERSNNFHLQRAQIVEELDQELYVWRSLISRIFRIKFKEKEEVYLHALVTKGSSYSLDAEKTAKKSDEWQGRNAKITGHIDEQMIGMSRLIDDKIARLEKLLVESRKISASENEIVKQRIEQLESLIIQHLGDNINASSIPQGSSTS